VFARVKKAAIRERERERERELVCYWLRRMVLILSTWGLTHLVQIMTIEGRHDEQEEEEEALQCAVSSGFFLGNELLSALSAQHVFFAS
jgi:hypothetical protein